MPISYFWRTFLQDGTQRNQMYHLNLFKMSEMIDESKRQMIEAELALTSMSPLERERLDRLEQKRRITCDRKLPPMQFLFRLFGRPCFPRGELVAITGKAKSGKTFVTSMLMALCATKNVLAFSRDDDPPLRLLWIDTEQSEESTQDILRNRITAMTQQSPPLDGLGDVFNLRGETWQERLPLLEIAIRHCRPDLVILDGIRDLVNDINDGVLAQQVIEQLMCLASEGQCCIVCVLHQNKASEDHSLRGWIGTELTNKAFEVYACEKMMPQRIFTLEQTHTRKYDIPDIMYYTVGENGLPVQSGIPSPSAVKTQKSDLPSLNPEYIVHEDSGGWHFDVERLFTDAMRGEEKVGGNELRDRVMQLTNIHKWTLYNDLLERAQEEKVILKTKKDGRVFYQPAPF